MGGSEIECKNMNGVREREGEKFDEGVERFCKGVEGGKSTLFREKNVNK